MKTMSTNEMMVANGGKYKCGYCDKVCLTAWGTKKHQRDKHSWNYIVYGYNFWWVN